MFNKINFNQMDNIYHKGSVPIDSITVSPNLIECVKEYRLFETDELIIIDHHSCIINLNLEQYFREYLSS